MNLSFETLMSMARFTVQSPREGARMVMKAGVPMGARWAAFALMAVLSSVLAHVSFNLMPAETQSQMGEAMSSPFRTALFQAGFMLFAVHAIVWVGRWRGGRGTFPDALILMVWLQFIMLILQLVQITAQVVLPPFAEILGIVSIAVSLWLLSNFIAEVHGFQSVAFTFLGVILFMLAAAFVLALVMVPLMPGAM